MSGHRVGPAAAGSSWLGKFTGVVAERRRAVLVVALVVACLAGVGAVSLFGATSPFSFSDPDSESARAEQRVEALTGSRPAPDLTIVVDKRAGGEVATVAAALEAVPGVASIRPVPGALGVADDRRAVLVGTLDAGVEDQAAVGERVLERTADLPGVVAGGTAIAGYEINEQSAEDLFEVERIVIPLIFVLSLFVFRSLVAAALPLLVAALSITCALATMRLLAELVSIDVFSINIVVGLGFGLAIDYSLFVVSRFREELARTDDSRAALGPTMARAGRTVIFSAVLVAVALAALIVFPQQFLYSSGIGAALVAMFSALTSVTVLPAALAALGPRVNSLAIGRPAGKREDPPELREGRGFWYRLGQRVCRWRLPVLITSVALLTLLGAQMVGVDLRLADAGDLPPDRSARQVSDLLDEAPSGTSTPVVVVVDEGDTTGALAPVIDEATELPGVAAVSAPRPIARNVVTVEITSSFDALSTPAERLMERVRTLNWPGEALVAGRTAELHDAEASLVSHLPIAIAIVVAAALVAVFLLTRSIVLPFLMAALNLLSVGAAFGLVVAIFQDGDLDGLLGVGGEGAIDISIPILFGAIAYGLSTDYGIFLLARIKEARDGGAGEEAAIAIGLSRTGRIISAAALLFAVAVGGFVTSELVLLRELSTGLIAAVLIDATIVRALLMPAALALLGRRAWWPQ